MAIDRKRLFSGLMAGFVGGAFLIVAYFAFDLVRNEPLATPSFLASGLLGQGAGEISPTQMGLFTALHFLAFLTLGVLANVVIEVTGAPRNAWTGAAYGLFALSIVFYGALVVSGASVVLAPAWPVVFFGNIMAGVVIMAYLQWSAEGNLKGFAPGLLDGRIVREGVQAGLLGAAVVALWFLVIDMVVGRPLYTPAALGSAMLYGAAAADAVLVSPATVLGYTVYHLAAFTFVGIIASALITQAVRFPPLFFGLILLFVVFETFVILLVAMLGAWLMQALAWWAILVGNILAAIAMGVFLRRQHPEISRSLEEDVLWSEP